MLTIFALAAGTLLLPGPILPMESDLSAMHPRPNAPLEALQTIAQRMGTSPGGSIIHLDADNDAALVHTAHVVRDRLTRKEVRGAGVVGSLGLASVLPDPSVTDSRLAAAKSINVDLMLKDFRAALSDSIFDAAAYQPYEEFLRTLITATKPPDLATLHAYPSLAQMILPTTPEPTHRESIMLLFMNTATETREDRDTLVDSVRSAVRDVPGVTFTGLSVLSHDAELTVRRDLPRLILIALAAVTLYLAIHFRNALDCALAILPTVFAFAALLAFMRLFGHKLGMVNLVAFPLLIGIGIDYGIFIVAGVRQSPNLTPPVTAVVMCCATTVLGFASLMTTSVPAVRSMGLAVAVGVAAAALAAALLVLPLCQLARRGVAA
jgi:predicted RND superfamily exporter protein